MKGFEPSTFAMARRRSSQLSYIRATRIILPGAAAVRPGVVAGARPRTPAPSIAAARRPRPGRAPAMAAQPLKLERPKSPKGSSRSRTASRKPASAARRWKA
jgi:hypothetical protein